MNKKYENTFLMCLNYNYELTRFSTKIGQQYIHKTSQRYFQLILYHAVNNIVSFKYLTATVLATNLQIRLGNLV